MYPQKSILSDNYIFKYQLKNVKVKTLQYPVQGRGFFFFLKDADKSYSFPQGESKERYA